MRSFSESAGPSGSSMRLFQVLPLIGVTADSAALATPGTPAAASSARRNSSGRSAGSSCARCALRLATRIGWRSKPGSRRASDENVRTNRPAATMSTSDRATCRTTSTLPRPSRPSPTTPRPCALSASFGCTRVPRSAGAIPNSTAVAMAMPAVNPSTRQSSGRLEEHGVGGRRQLPHEQPAAPLREEQPDQRADAGQQQALAQQLPRDPHARRAQGDAHAELVPARRRAREEQVRDVRARDEEHEADDHHDGGQRQAVALAQRRTAGRRGDQREALFEVGLHVLRAPVLRHRGFADLRLDAPDRGVAGLEALTRLAGGS